jgi:hypothetical protein
VVVETVKGPDGSVPVEPSAALLADRDRNFRGGKAHGEKSVGREQRPVSVARVVARTYLKIRDGCRSAINAE